MKTSLKNKSTFSRLLLKWYETQGRHDFPWQKNRNLYRVWISEIMLQQTQVTTVIPYFERFMQRFPNIAALAKAEQDEVLHLWTGLGYYARARNLHKTAQVINKDFAGNFPENFEHMLALPGIGRSTAGAILAQALGQRHVILDGNVKRVLTRLFAIEGWPGQKIIENKLWELADTLTPETRLTHYTQAIMDLGATVCARKCDCPACPVMSLCAAYELGNPQAFPTPKPRKSLPVKETQMLVIQNDKGEILLEQRPPSGIWGGLWSLPECKKEDIPRWCEKHLGLIIHNNQPQSLFRHTFSHFHLDITPITAQVKNPANLVMEATNRVWYNTLQPKQLGLPAPVLKILRAENFKLPTLSNE